MSAWISQFLCTPGEKKYKKYGWKRDLMDQRDKHICHQNFEYQDNIDLRNKCPEVYNQGKLGSCTANAIAAAYQFDMMKQMETDCFIPSRLFIYYNERNVENTVNSDSGAEIRDGIKSINKLGVVPEELWPYDISKFTVKPPDNLYKEAIKHHSVEYHRVQQTVNDLKQTLNNGFPIVFGFAVYESFESEQVAKTGVMSIPKNDEKLLGGHAVMAVGYRSDEKVFIVRNSWGSNWGDKGYFYMPEDFIADKNMASDFWVVQKVIDQ